MKDNIDMYTWSPASFLLSVKNKEVNMRVHSFKQIGDALSELESAVLSIIPYI